MTPRCFSGLSTGPLWVPGLPSGSSKMYDSIIDFVTLGPLYYDPIMNRRAPGLKVMAVDAFGIVTLKCS